LVATSGIVGAEFLSMSFDFLAPHYRWLELILAGDKLQRCRTAFLRGDYAPGRVLLLGEGNGRFLLECRQQWPAAQLTCVDSSPRMLELARKRLQRHGLDPFRVEYVCADALRWPLPKSSFDLIVTNFFLDCFGPKDLKELIPTLAKAAVPRATWWLSDFRVPTGRLLRWRALLIHRLMYRFFRVVTRLRAVRLTAPDQLLSASGFELSERRVSEWGLLHADCWVRG
jgi:ubiquinone/menaquinone biosynthesis C-methylase UbiE